MFKGGAFGDKADFSTIMLFFFFKHGLSRGFLKDGKEPDKLTNPNFSSFRSYFSPQYELCLGGLGHHPCKETGSLNSTVCLS